MILVGQIKHAQHAGGADRAATGSCAWLGDGLIAGVVDVAQIVFGSGCRSCFTAIIGLHSLVGGVVIEHEGATANARRFWYREPEHGLHCHRSIHRVAALGENLAAGFAGQCTGAGYHEVVCVSCRLSCAVA
jgi:hypothetical protein